jgi:drug/metabolite transporter (DMT)-like permease
MLWLYFVLANAFFWGTWNILARKFLKEEHDYLGFSTMYQFVGAAIALPFALTDPSFSLEALALSVVVASSVAWSASAVLTSRSLQLVEVSLRDPLSRTGIFWALLFSFLLLGESITLNKVIGVIAIFAGIVVIYFKIKLGNLRAYGVALTLLTGVFGGFAVSVDKIGMKFFSPVFYNFLLFILPGIMLFFGTRRNAGKMKMFFYKNKLVIIILSAFATFSYLCLLSALRLQQASIVLPVSQIGLIISVVGGIFLLKEKEGIARKIIGSLIVLAGAALVSAS